MGINITQQIEIIKKMIEEKTKVYLGDGYVTDFQCKFYEPATIAEINQFEKTFNVVIPPDYKEFLLITNGMYFMDIMQFYNLSDIGTIIETGVYRQGIFLMYSISAFSQIANYRLKYNNIYFILLN